MRKILVVAASVATMATAGCATLGRQVFKQPVVTFKDLRVAGVGLTGGTVDVVLGVYNPNGYRLDATNLTYNLLIGGTQLGSGTYNSRLTVRSGDSTFVTLPVTLDYKGLSAAGRQLASKGAVNYRVLGNLQVGTPIGNFTVPYDQTGRFTAFGGAQRQ